jgi:hypothetical protein
VKKSKIKSRRIQHAVALAPSQKSTSALQEKGDAKVIEYGEGNLLPSQIMAVFLASPTARRCLKKLKKFIQADGFASNAAGAVLVNPKQRANALLPLLAWDLSMLSGFVLKVKYTLHGEIGEIYHVPLHTVRRLDDGRFLVNPTLGSAKVDNSKNTYHSSFDNSPAAVQAVMAEYERTKVQVGQIMYVFEENSAHPYYPEPDAWAGKEDFESDIEIKIADYNAIKHRVKPNVGIYIPGEYDEDTKDEHGNTELDDLIEEVRMLTDPDGTGDAAMFFGATKDDAPQLLEMDSMKSTLSMDAKSETIRKRICSHIGVHPVLIGLDTAGKLGNTQELLNSIQLMQQEVLDAQGMIQQTFDVLLPGMDWTISSLNILKALPEQVWQTMDENEKRNFLGLAEVEENEQLQKFNRLPDTLKQKVLDAMTPQQILELTGFEQETTTETEANATNTGRLSKIRAAVGKYLPGRAAK